MSKSEFYKDKAEKLGTIVAIGFAMGIACAAMAMPIVGVAWITCTYVFACK